MVAEALDTEYENGVADILSYLAGSAATVERNVQMPSRKTRSSRQIDIKVTGSMFGITNATMIVDCKRYSKKLDITHVESFLGLADDVGAEIGLLVNTRGVSSAAQEFAENVRGIRLVTVSIEELAKWSPAGTVEFVYAVPTNLYLEAARAARRAGFRVREVPLEPTVKNVMAFSAFRHANLSEDTKEKATGLQQTLLAALARAGIDGPELVEVRVVAYGGTPAYRQLKITVAGIPVGPTLRASTEEEIAGLLDAWSFELGIERKLLDVIRPAIWPIPNIFPHWEQPGSSRGPYLVIRGLDDGGATITSSEGMRLYVPPATE